uniref:Uncharacterized protein n=1 Tax=Oryza sativa subsp. japonica TaxID=39947 RepID=Q6K6B5_ORYSJ|nr:hypothetical protein [Oryza sativa Japonica Group]
MPENTVHPVERSPARKRRGLARAFIICWAGPSDSGAACSRRQPIIFRMNFDES